MICVAFAHFDPISILAGHRAGAAYTLTATYAKIVADSQLSTGQTLSHHIPYLLKKIIRRKQNHYVVLLFSRISPYLLDNLLRSTA